MGGDFGPRVTVPASLKLLQKYSDVRLVLVGDRHVLETFLTREKNQGAPILERLVIRHTSQAVTMDESPGYALRQKKDSSMRVALNLVKENEALACVSAGNTGALMATARFVLKMLPGI